ncbi:MAG TPA: sugar ABC transporter permease [Chloroflexus aurantiacus]|uniref:Binding-protein-dependent transport systems inner membrane component n=1 Tax=Chloroflexus aurantiacus (strain ATCC 29366 / DSM 635 / J-10-fl) TaxID=324602 RepID=A9WJ61_CHLAA|nr:MULTISPECIES: sugar ABC transporter permease [Chloroflexus]ABY34338.1 binding-protein-dependent transport systems inner membrane component [Chloroflexus aurantiacus J-10-fl]RMG48118.1 MAG: sugar ABC transporter permease [Chloroflexota bacterium]GIV95288.1 MAG: ABC transporter permease [Chloroflexus sp.]HBW68579.1 sugar ABC transporter permease [Chloroflexus aurantiacus]
MKARIWSRVTPYLFLAPALIFMSVFTLYPLVAVGYYSFTEYDILRPPTPVGFANYQHLLNDNVFWLSLRNSFVYLIVTPTIIILSIALAIALNRKLPGISFFRTLYYIPVITGSVAIGIAWQFLFNGSGGPINGLLIWLGVIEKPIVFLTEPDFILPIAMLMTIWMGVGYYMVIFLAALQNISEDLYDAALIDGCNRWQKHWHVSIPGIRPAIVFVAVISSLSALKVFDEIYILTNATGGVLNSGSTIVFYLWKQAFRLQNVGYASAIAMVLLIITLSFSIINVRLLEQRDD